MAANGVHFDSTSIWRAPYNIPIKDYQYLPVSQAVAGKGEKHGREGMKRVGETELGE